MRGILACTLLVTLAGSAFAQHGGDMWLGQSETGQVTNAGVDLSAPIYLPPSAVAGPLGGGWALNSPGFDHVSFPSDGVFPLAPSAELSFTILSMTPGLRMISPDLSTIVDDAGQSAQLGGADLHVHWTFHVHNPEDAEYEEHAHYQCTLQITDSSGAIESSEPITLYFQTEEVLIGDVDLDSELTSSDLDAFYAVVTDPATASSTARIAADANLDGQVSLEDLCPITVALELSDGFVRGDANEDLSVDVADAVSMLGILFSADPAPNFSAALDANNDVAFDLADPIFILGFLFADGTSPAAPFPLPGCP